jgi:hypothetical protein
LIDLFKKYPISYKTPPAPHDQYGKSNILFGVKLDSFIQKEITKKRKNIIERTFS